MSKRLVEFVDRAYVETILADLQAIEAPDRLSRRDALDLLQPEILRLAGKGYSTAKIRQIINKGAMIIRADDIELMVGKAAKKPQKPRRKASSGTKPAHEVAATGTQSAHPPNGERHENSAQTAQERSAPVPQTGRIHMPTDEDDEC